MVIETLIKMMSKFIAHAVISIRMGDRFINVSNKRRQNTLAELNITVYSSTQHSLRFQKSISF